MSKLWDKGIPVNKLVEQFTVGNDREMDLMLAASDVLGSLAHIRMLRTINLLTEDELKILSKELVEIYKVIQSGHFIIEDGVEDVHSQVEMLLTKKLGDVGKKIHSGRSRNDQVLVDIRLYLRDEIMQITPLVKNLFDTLISQSEKYKNALIPGYTHFQVAMPSSFGLWFGAYAESLSDDMILMNSAFRIINQNPLGSAAGYGSSFPLNRTMTTKLLGFEDLSYNVVYAQMGRGKSEKTLAFAMSSVAATLAKMSMDMCLFLCQNFAFCSFPEELTTGSSIMPHKKNPDVFELIRAKCNRLQALPNDIAMMTTNLPSGYHRDLQILKESLFPAIQSLKDCLAIADMMLGKIIVNENVIKDEKYKYCFSVEEVNKLVLQGVPFRDAYKKVGEQIQAGNFKPDTTVKHTHEGSIGNLCNTEIRKKMDKTLSSFDLSVISKAVNDLIHI